MTTISSSNPLSNMLGNVFARLDRDGSKSLDRGEFQFFYEVLKPGIAADADGTPQIGEAEQFTRMDKDSDGVVSQSEVQTAGVLMPAELTDESLLAMIEYLKRQEGAAASATASLLADGGLPVETDKHM